MSSEKKPVKFEELATGKHFTLAGIANTNGGKLKKIMVGDNQPDSWVKVGYPDTEIVDHPGSIINDAEIDLVIVPGIHRQPDVVAEIISAGKNVRIL